MHQDVMVAALREAIDSAVTTAPVQSPIGTDLLTTLQGIRRRRRVRRAAQLGVAIASVAAAAFALQLLAQQANAPEPYLPAAREPTKLSGLPPRGSLADDSAWMAKVPPAVKHLVATEFEAESSVKGDVSVIFAGDVYGKRVVLAEANIKDSDDIVVRRQLWLTGEVDARPDQLTIAQYGDANEVAYYRPGRVEPDDGDDQSLFIVAHPDQPLRLVYEAEVDRNGVVSWPGRDLAPRSPGIWLVDEAPEGVNPAWLIAPDAFPEAYDLMEPNWEGHPPGGVSEAEVRELTPLRGKREVDDSLVEAVNEAQSNAMLPLAESERSLLWSGSLDGNTADVFAVTAKSGAHVITATFTQPLSGDDPTRHCCLESNTRVAPAGQTTELTMGWRFLVGEGESLIGALGPKQATMAVFTQDNTEVERLELVDGAGMTTTIQDPDRVAFLNADGKKIGSVEVIPPGKGALRPPDWR